MPPGCYGLTLENGKTYDADISGRITVDDEDAHWVENCKNFQQGHILKMDGRFTASSMDGKYCPECGRGCYPWTTTCGRCGYTVKGDEEP